LAAADPAPPSRHRTCSCAHRRKAPPWRGSHMACALGLLSLSGTARGPLAHAVVFSNNRGVRCRAWPGLDDRPGFRASRRTRECVGGSGSFVGGTNAARGVPRSDGHRIWSPQSHLVGSSKCRVGSLPAVPHAPNGCSVLLSSMGFTLLARRRGSGCWSWLCVRRRGRALLLKRPDRGLHPIQGCRLSQTTSKGRVGSRPPGFGRLTT